MDEIDWIKSFKKVLILFLKISIGFSVVTIIFPLISFISNPKDSSTIDILIIFLMAGFSPTIILAICFAIIFIINKFINSGKAVINFKKEYIRILPKYCSPAIASLVYDLKTDVYKDYTATVLYLYTQKYINIEKVEERFKIVLGKNNEYSSLGECEKYVLDVISSKKEFNALNFEKIIINEAQEKDLLTNKKYSKIPRILVVLIIALLLLIITYKINLILFYVCTTLVLTSAYACSGLINNDEKIKYKRTKDGKNIALLLKGLKRYMKEYTLIKDKEIDYIQILENYIPYALALGEADAVEEFIKNNEDYRNLIYNRSSM